LGPAKRASPSSPRPARQLPGPPGTPPTAWPSPPRACLPAPPELQPWADATQDLTQARPPARL